MVIASHLELTDQVKVRVHGASNGGVVVLPFAVVFASAHVDGSSAPKSGDAVSGVEDPEVADLKGDEFSYTEATDCGLLPNRHHEPIPVVP